jgi:hypothetical protein
VEDVLAHELGLSCNVSWHASKLDVFEVVLGQEVAKVVTILGKQRKNFDQGSQVVNRGAFVQADANRIVVDLAKVHFEFVELIDNVVRRREARSAAVDRKGVKEIVGVVHHMDLEHLQIVAEDFSAEADSVCNSDQTFRLVPEGEHGSEIGQQRLGCANV